MQTLPAPVGGDPALTFPLTNEAEKLSVALDSAREYARAESADATVRAYRSDFADFLAWCGDMNREALPASIDTTAAYLAAAADRGLKVSTLMRRAAAIAYAHRRAGFEPPTNAGPVKAVLKGIRRRIGVAVERKAPATARAITAMLKRIPDDMLGRRDRALLLLGFAAALRRSELVGLDVADLERTADGILVHIRRSKTDQEGAGHVVAVPRGSRLLPVEAVEQWLRDARIADGPVFRQVHKGGHVGRDRLSDRAVARVVQLRAEAAKLDPRLFSGHSLRSGFVTSALEAGADLLKVMDVTRHRSVETLKGYDRRAKVFKNHAGGKFL